MSSFCGLKRGDCCETRIFGDKVKQSVFGRPAKDVISARVFERMIVAKAGIDAAQNDGRVREKRMQDCDGFLNTAIPVSHQRSD